LHNWIFFIFSPVVAAHTKQLVLPLNHVVLSLFLYVPNPLTPLSPASPSPLSLSSLTLSSAFPSNSLQIEQVVNQPIAFIMLEGIIKGEETKQLIIEQPHCMEPN
jgi:hypothetical protein